MSKHISTWHVKKAFQSYKQREIEELNKLEKLINKLIDKVESKNQLKLDYLDQIPDTTEEPILKYIIDEKKFNNFIDFDIWCKKYGPETVVSCLFSSCGEKYSYQEIRQTVKNYYQKKEYEILQ